MENLVFHEEKVDSFVDNESEHFGAFYDRDVKIITKRNKCNLAQIDVENPRQKVDVNDSARLSANVKGTALDKDEVEERIHSFQYVPSTPPQIDLPFNAITPDEAKVPNAQSNLQDKAQQTQSYQYSKQKLKNQGLRKTLGKDNGNAKNENLSQSYGIRSQSKKECEPYHKQHKTLAEDGSDSCVHLCALPCSIYKDGRDGDHRLHIITNEIDEDDSGDVVNCDLEGDEESCDLTLLENLQSVMIMKQFNQKYLQQHINTSTVTDVETKQHAMYTSTLTAEREVLEASKDDYLNRISKKSNDEENNVKRGCSKEASCFLQASLPVKQDGKLRDTLAPISGESCQENQYANQDHSDSVNTNDSEKNAPAITDTAITTLSTHPHSKSPSDAVAPYIVSNTPISINSQFGFSNIAIIGSTLMSNGTVSNITEANGHKYENDPRDVQPSGVRSESAISHNPGFMIFDMTPVPCMMMVMSGAFSPGMSISPSSSVNPVYTQASRPPLSLTASQYHQNNNESQTCTQQKAVASSYPCTKISSTSTDSTSSCCTTQLSLPPVPVIKHSSTTVTLSNSGVQYPSLTVTICNTSPCTTVESLCNGNPQYGNADCSVESQKSPYHSACIFSSSSSLTVCEATTPDICCSNSRDSVPSISPSTGITLNPQGSFIPTLSDQIPSSFCNDSLSSLTSTKTSSLPSCERVLNDDSPNTDKASATAKENTVPEIEHTFKTPKRRLPYQDLRIRLSSETSQKNSTMIRVSPRYSDTKGCCPPLVLVSKNLAPLQPIRGQAQQYVITQGHDRRVLKECTITSNYCEDRTENTKRPIYLKGTPPQGYKRRLLSRSSSKQHRQTRLPKTTKCVLFEKIEEPQKLDIGVISKKDSNSAPPNTDLHSDPKNDYLRGQINIDSMATEVLQEITEVLSESRDVAAAKVLSPSARVKQTTLSECLREFLSSPQDTPTLASIDNKSSPPTPNTPERRQYNKKPSQKTSKDFRRPKTPKVEDKKRKKERDHQNCVELRECVQELSRILPGTQRSWSRLRLLNHALDYMEKMIKRLEGLGVSCIDICKEGSSSLPHEQVTSTSDNKSENNRKNQETSDQIVLQQLEATRSPTVQPSDKYIYSGPLMNVSELVITTESETKGRWINLCDITTVLSNSAQVPLEDSSHVSSMVENRSTVDDSSVYLVEVTDDSTLLTPLDCTSIIDQALTLSNITQEDQISASSCRVDVGEQCRPSIDNTSDIHECCQGLLALQNQQFPDVHHEAVADLNNTVSPYGYKNASSLESSPVNSQRKNSDHLVNSPRLTDLLASPVVVIPQDTCTSEDHRFPDTSMTGMSPFIVPSSPDVSIATEMFFLSSSSQGDTACTPCGVVSEDPLSYVSPFTTPRLGFSPTFAELSPGRIVSDNECCQQESPIQRATTMPTVCSVTDFSEVGLTSVAASVEICSSSEQHQATHPKRRYRKRQPKAQHDSELAVDQKKSRKYQPKKPRDSSTKSKPKNSNYTPKSFRKQTRSDTNQTEKTVPKQAHDLQQEHDSFKTPSPRVRKGKLKRAVIPEVVIPRKQVKIKKEPKPKKSVCKRQLLDS